MRFCLKIENPILSVKGVFCSVFNTYLDFSSFFLFESKKKIKVITINMILIQPSKNSKKIQVSPKTLQNTPFLLKLKKHLKTLLYDM
jgi:hypothetical protein